ncbi:Sigma-70, region 4 [Ignavigranum ruoffiae]|uniref:Sigma-70, region 4 n=1 Tax=Ignavigranum ruoffiae TaxID=89093 RepID=A0A1H9C2A9_9LACT|nr:sigma-70 family RNA polymerase sigma factor [Ignavigranum ruoffiae]UPQ86360.1 sigma-70 family RNA polymerase sigma factor [Ignavigranum ruoffiae]SEP95282.1 Sigma-70, region 4 [Ignavigranum ruoffiae]
MKKIALLSNEQLVEAYQQSSNQDYLVELFDRFKPLIRSLSRQYFIIDYDNDDFEQEVRVALLKAVRTFNLERRSFFAPYARCVCRNHIINIARYRLASCRGGGKKDLSLNVEVDGDSVDTLSLLPDTNNLPIYEICSTQSKFIRVLNSLSKLEKQVLHKYLSEGNYKKIAEELGMSLKKVHDTIYRCRKKFKQLA